MPIDIVRLQQIVDEMSTPGKNGWVLNHDYAPAFFTLIAPYIKKAADKSEYNSHGDPEDAFAETWWQVWRALEKYGPRPRGNLFGEYTLKLKTNNVLTNRQKKRMSQKSCLNFVSESLDGLEALEQDGERHYVPPSCAPLDLCLLMEEIEEQKLKESLRKKRRRKVYKKDPVEEHILLINDVIEQHILAEDVVERHVLLENDPVEQHINLIYSNKLNYSLYDKNNKRRLRMNKLDDVKVGDKFITKAGGKVIEIRSKTRKGFKILVVLTGKEIPVDDDYIKNSVEIYEDDVDPVEQTFEDPVEAVVEKPVEKVAEKEVVEPPKKRRGRKPGTKNSKKPKPNKGEKKMAKPKTARKETKKALILELLNQGPQTRDSLATAIIEKGLSKHNDVTKEKSYASVILHNLKKDGVPVKRIERGKYVLETTEAAEAPAETAETTETTEE